jgi:DNA-binding protein HU-beta
MKKSELVAKVAQKTGLSKKDTQAVIDATVEILKEALKNGEKISFIGFGSFEPVTRAARVTRIPRKNEAIKIPETKSVKFKVGKKLKELLNS